MMNEEQRQASIRRYNEGMRPMSEAMMAIRAAEQAEGMRNAWPDGIARNRGQSAMANLWGDVSDAKLLEKLPTQPRPTLWERFKRLVGA